MLCVNRYARRYIAVSSAVTAVLAHALGLDRVAEYIWMQVVPQKMYWSFSNLLRGAPVSDTEHLICEIFSHIPVERIDEIDASIHVIVYNVDTNASELHMMTSKNALELTLASCYLPFLSHFPQRRRNISLEGKRYIDGSARDIIPIDAIDSLGCPNVLFVANYPYYWLPDPVPLPLRLLAGMTQPNGRYLYQDLCERERRFAAVRRDISNPKYRPHPINLHVVGPKFIKDKYAIEHPADQAGICRTMQKARDLADSDRESFEAWISQLPDQPPVP